MISASNITKRFADCTAINNLSCTIPDGCIYGLVGSNGAGKSTFLRCLSGIYRQEAGDILIDGKSVYDNQSVKEQIVFIPDDLYFLPQSNMRNMSILYKALYPQYSEERFEELIMIFGLDPDININSFSKGMKRQAATILALASKPKYLFFDETFDGLDPVMRNLVKNIIYEDVMERQTTTIITSHSLRELEDTCDQLALLHKGGIVFESDIQNLKTNLFKIQAAFDHEFSKADFAGLDIINYQQTGSVCNFICRGDREQTIAGLRSMQPLLLDVLPLNLEEVFIYEMEALGYAFQDIN